jgi:PAS domain S-box-containing protein
MEMCMLTKPKILIVDDEPRMCDSLEFLLSRQDYEIRTANSGQEALDVLSGNEFDVALLDIVMPDMDGHRLMDHINTLNPDTFVIFITGHASLDSAVRALRRGAYDYLRKPFDYDELLRTLQNALNQKRLKSENETVSGKLAQSEESYRYLVQNSPDIIYMLDDQGNFTFISRAAERLLGFEIDHLAGKHYSTIIYEEDLEKANWFFNERRTGDRAASGIELRLKVHGNGKDDKNYEILYLTVELKATGMYDKPTTEKEKKYLGAHGVARDISDRKHLEAQLQHAHRMEALGTLGGGIAHDFNNLLMGIQGNASLMLLDIDSTHPYYQKLKNIEQYVQNGAELTSQLLGFARGGKYEVKPTDLNILTKRSSEMFARTKKEIRIQRKYQEDIWKVEVDRGQIEQVLLNLFVNAWQAMPGGGELYIETENVILDKNNVKHYHLKPGKYVKISVSDTGVGMDEITQQKIFEPFFTTKKMGRGTGLGLASTFGIINNHGGIIRVSSRKGEGSTFDIYLPASEKEIDREKALPEKILKGKETILLVDDEEMILDVGKQILEEMGYRALTARSGEEAIRVYKEKGGRIDMMILDMIMPEMGGGEAYDRLKLIDSDIKCLLSSGYSIDGQATEILERGCDGFIQKPFDLKLLSQKIREILDA